MGHENRSAGISLILAVSAVCVLLVISQLLLKQSLRQAAHQSTGIGAALVSVLPTAAFWLAILCTAAASVLWLGSLQRAPLSVVYPILSLSYVLMVPAARLVYGEPVTAAKLAGAAVICFGVLLVSRA